MNLGPVLRSRWLLVVTAIAITLGMVHLASTGTSVSFPTRRPGGPTPFTWDDSPFGFILYGVMVYVVACCTVLIFRAFGQFLVEEIRVRRRRRRW